MLDRFQPRLKKNSKSTVHRKYKGTLMSEFTPAQCRAPKFTTKIRQQGKATNTAYFCSPDSTTNDACEGQSQSFGKNRVFSDPQRNKRTICTTPKQVTNPRFIEKQKQIGGTKGRRDKSFKTKFAIDANLRSMKCNEENCNRRGAAISVGESDDDRENTSHGQKKIITKKKKRYDEKSVKVKNGHRERISKIEREDMKKKKVYRKVNFTRGEGLNGSQYQSVTSGKVDSCRMCSLIARYKGLGVENCITPHITSLSRKANKTRLSQRNFTVSKTAAPSHSGRGLLNLRPIGLKTRKPFTMPSKNSTKACLQYEERNVPSATCYSNCQFKNKREGPQPCSAIPSSQLDKTKFSFHTQNSKVACKPTTTEESLDKDSKDSFTLPKQTCWFCPCRPTRGWCSSLTTFWTKLTKLKTDTRARYFCNNFDAA